MSPTTARRIRPALASAAQSHTATGTMLGVEDQLQILTQSNPDGTVTRCGVIGGTLRTPTGDVNFGAGGILRPDDTLEPAVQALIDTIREASRRGTTAVATITYYVRSCGYLLDAIVTDATAKFPSPYDTKPKVTKRGRITRMSRPSVVSGYGASCRVWRGSPRTRTGVRWPFSIETELTGSPARAADRRAVMLARTLRRARAKRASTTITFAGPVIACGKTLRHVVTRASTTRRPKR